MGVDTFVRDEAALLEIFPLFSPINLSFLTKILNDFADNDRLASKIILLKNEFTYH
jgi:hypothetical protein